jgi:eukaryotic-like serine/threonine-protein kinase
MPNLTGQSIGRYQILEQVGEGGMAIIYKAYDTRLEYDVAIKFIRTEKLVAENVDKTLKRFKIEARETSQLIHPNIVGVTDFGEYEGIPFLVMRYIPGGTLKQKLGQPMAYQEAVRLLLPIARALEYAHRQNIVHRDVKPANILITSSGEAMLSDFGIAKILISDDETQDSLTGTGVGIGTPEYMAPEQGIGHGVDQRSDIYALGVVFYELVTGRKPFMADTPMAVVIKQVTERLPHPRQFVPSLPEAVEKVIIKALAKNPEDRFQSMAEFATALEKLALHGKIHAPESENKKSVVRPSKPAGRIAIKKAEAEGNLKPSGPKPLPHRRLPGWFWIGIGLIGFTIVVIQLMAPKASVGLAGLMPTRTPALTFSQTTANVNTPTKQILPITTPVTIASIVNYSGENKTQVSHEIDHPTSAANSILVPTSQITETPSPTPVPTLSMDATKISPKDGMVLQYVPAGEFEMGSANGLGKEDEYPQHKVSLNAFWIDRTEVTNMMFFSCVSDKTCNIGQFGFYVQNSDYPATYVDWSQAQAYCKWAGMRLPTEAEWEKAARGTDGRLYPWGNDTDKSYLANSQNGLSQVGSFPKGASPYGVLDMAGNVMEWVADWYSPSYYQNSPNDNPLGPTTGTFRVLRGGSWESDWTGVRVSSRNSKNPNSIGSAIGFRCVMPE